MIIKLHQWAEDGERKVVARKTSVYGNAFRCCCTVVVKGTVKRILERLEIQTSSSFVKI